VSASERIDLRKYVRDVPDFPKPGILFRDLTPLLADPRALRAAVDAVAAPFREDGVEQVIGIESRGFILGAPVALALGSGLVIVRKEGKLPGRTARITYDLEYGSDTLEMHADSITPGQRVLVVDDLVATGGTAAAAVRLARQSGADVVGCAFLIELAALGGRKLLDVDRVHCVLRY
jgi:adenine phosphoribosyltransferase